MKPKVIILYRCPKCEGYMECEVKSLWDKKAELWKCVKCKRRFKLSFKELKQNSKEISTNAKGDK